MRHAVFATLLSLAGTGDAVAQDRSFKVTNNTAQVVNEVYVSPVSTSAWGHDRLGSEVIAAGTSQIVRLPADGQCRFDLRIVYQGGAVEERRNLDTCRLTDLVLGGAAPLRVGKGGNPSFNLVNRTGQSIAQVFAVPAATPDWGDDRLGHGSVRPGQRVAVRLPQGECDYNIRVALQDGTVRDQSHVDLCGLTDYVVQ